jgi:hypothetical protein
MSGLAAHGVVAAAPAAGRYGGGTAGRPSLGSSSQKRRLPQNAQSLPVRGRRRRNASTQSPPHTGGIFRRSLCILKAASVAMDSWVQRAVVGEGWCEGRGACLDDAFVVGWKKMIFMVRGVPGAQGAGFQVVQRRCAQRAAPVVPSLWCPTQQGKASLEAGAAVGGVYRCCPRTSSLLMSND